MHVYIALYRNVCSNQRSQLISVIIGSGDTARARRPRLHTHTDIHIYIYISASHPLSFMVYTCVLSKTSFLYPIWAAIEQYVTTVRHRVWTLLDTCSPRRQLWFSRHEYHLGHYIHSCLWFLTHTRLFLLFMDMGDGWSSKIKLIC